MRSFRLEEGGVVRAVLDICGGLAERGHQVTLVTFDVTDVPAEWKQGAAELPAVVEVSPKRVAAEFESRNLLAGADILHLHTPWERANLPLAKLARQRNVPYIVTPHGMLDDWPMRQKSLKKRFYLALVGRRFLSDAAAVHCTAEAELQQASKYLRPGSGVVVPLPIDLGPYSQLPGPELALTEFPRLGPDVPRLLFLSRLHPKKRPELLIEAAAKLRASGREVQVLLAGPGDADYVASLRRLVHQHGLERNVAFPGMVRGNLKVSLYQSADAFVLPTSQENFGYVLIEAMAAGTPVVTTRGVDIHEELARAGAKIVEPEPAVLAQAIEWVLQDLPNARQLGRRAREWVFSELAAARIMASYERMYLAAGIRSSRE